MSQKGHYLIMDKTSQLYKNIYVLPFTNHGNHGKFFFIHSYECQEIQIKNPINENLGLIFYLTHLKMSTYYVKRSQFCKGLSKGLI
jgi:hypothetical protein